MALDRGTLAKIDRRVFAELDHTGGVQTVKVPLSDAVWSTWRRYCDALGLSMGEGVAALILHELETVVSDDGDSGPAFLEHVGRQVEERAGCLDARERELDNRAERLRKREQQLRLWEQKIRSEKASTGPGQGAAKVGRNGRCPCGSGLKYKHCHGLPGYQR